MSVTPTLPEVISEAIESRLIDVHTALPGRVQSISGRTVTVELMVKRAITADDETLITEELPILPSVPIADFKAGGFFFALPVAEGTTGMVIFSEVPTAQWRATGGVSSPEGPSRHTLSAGLFIPCYTTTDNEVDESIGTDLALGAEGGAQLRGKDGTVEITSNGAATAADFVAMSTKVDTYIAKLDAVLRGWPVAVQDGGAALKSSYISAVPIPPTSVASTNLKAD